MKSAISAALAVALLPALLVVMLSGSAGQNTGTCALPDGAGITATGPWPEQLNPLAAAQVAAAAGFDETQLVIAVAVAGAESDYNRTVEYHNSDAARSTDYGLWQINSRWNAEHLAIGDWDNPWDNARMAKAAFDRSGWRDWVTYKTGRYRRYLDKATEAVAQLNTLTTPQGCAPTAGGGTDTSDCKAVAGTQPLSVTTEVPDGHGNRIRVHKCLAPAATRLFQDATTAGLALSGWGWRDNAKQIELRRQHCGTSHYAIHEMPSSQCSPPTARPGHSQHERGLAIDFTCRGTTVRRNDPCFRWLNANAAHYGLKNLPSESWHWSTTGS